MVRRTALITAASVAGVVIAGAAVVGANIRILDSAADGGIGELSATTVPVAEDVAAEGPDESQSYAVAAAGTVLVERFGAELRLASVTTAPGWTHTIDDQRPEVLLVTYTDGTTTYQFLATLGPDGNVSAGVSQPVDEVVVVPGPPGSAGAPADSSGSAPSPAPAELPGPSAAVDAGDDSEYEEYEGGEDDDREYDEYEAGEDDDREYEEYEGGEDDD